MIVFLGNIVLLVRKYCQILILWYASRFADQEVRSLAVTWIEAISDDELIDLLPQFVQVSFLLGYLSSLLSLFLMSKDLAKGSSFCFD